MSSHPSPGGNIKSLKRCLGRTMGIPAVTGSLVGSGAIKENFMEEMTLQLSLKRWVEV